MEKREQIIKDCETMRRALTDFAALDAEIERQLEETQVVAEPVSYTHLSICFAWSMEARYCSSRSL